MPVYYEWDCEEVSDVEQEGYAKDDVIDHNHSRTYKEALELSKTTPPDGSRWDIVLVRDDDHKRAWAYMSDGENGNLPAMFCDANGVEYKPVPQRFINEVNHANRKAK
jgi:hypothetical protein